MGFKWPRGYKVNVQCARCGKQYIVISVNFERAQQIYHSNVKRRWFCTD